MRVSSRIVLCFFIISAASFYYPLNWVLNTMKVRYLEGVEDPLVDQANSLAAIIGLGIEQGTFDLKVWQDGMQRAYQRKVNARIYQFKKDQVDMIFYLTDVTGKVLLHSALPGEVGKDYSIWRDVSFTLKGKYGARASQNPFSEEPSSILYVAAPIRVHGELFGVLAVGKPTTNITWFVEHARAKLIMIVCFALLLAGVLGFFAARWITIPIKRLTEYARAVKGGERVDFPQLGKSEIGEMGIAFQEMQDALEGKQYVEQYIQNLTHEIKSPLSAIRGAAELLDEPMNDVQRKRFLTNIHTESLRIQKIIDRMLELSSLESKRRLGKREEVRIKPLINTAIESMESICVGKRVAISLHGADDLHLAGDSFLLHQALVNLIQNAVDFSPPDALIKIEVSSSAELICIAVIDEGTGLADFSKERIFEKFFSLPRPDTNKKSTGLGLNFVREVAQLHGGDIALENRQEKGLKALLSLGRDIERNEWS